jgi:hypothetical protein
MEVTPSDEFNALRDEILKWQEKRFEVLTAACLGLGAAVGGAVAQKQTWDWSLASSAVHVILALAAHMTCTCGYFTTMGGAYMEVFLNSQWEARNRAFRKKTSVPQLNRAIALIYFALAVTANIICYTLCARNPPSQLTILWAVTAIALVVSLIRLAFRSYPRDKLVNYWKEIQTEQPTVPSPLQQVPAAGADSSKSSPACICSAQVETASFSGPQSDLNETSA